MKSAATIGVSMGVGDALCQTIDTHNENFKVERTFNMWFIGTFISGPLGHGWQILIENFLPGTSTRRVLQKTASNSVYAFVLSLPLMFTAVTLLSKDQHGKRKSIHDAKEKIEKDLVETFIAGALFWPAVNIVVFKCVPTENRAIVSSLVGTLWNIYLSLKANSNIPIVEHLSVIES